MFASTSTRNAHLDSHSAVKIKVQKPYPLFILGCADCVTLLFRNSPDIATPSTAFMTG